MDALPSAPWPSCNYPPNFVGINISFIILFFSRLSTESPKIFTHSSDCKNLYKKFKTISDFRHNYF